MSGWGRSAAFAASRQAVFAENPKSGGEALIAPAAGLFIPESC
jgi:hypothetical protein